MSEVSKKWFNYGYAKLLMYLSQHVGLDIEADRKLSDGFEIGKWMQAVREYWQNGLLTQKQEYQLEQIGMSIDESMQSWESVYRYARNYYMDNAVLPNGRSYRTDDGVILGAWIDRQKRFGFMLADEQKEKLKAIGIDVEVYQDGN